MSPPTRAAAAAAGQERPAGTFPSTQWSVVLAAGGADDRAREALGWLCSRYREALVSYARRRGASREEAEDLVQGFLVHLLEHDTLARARRDRGRFRSFLLGCFNYHLADARDHARAARRGDGQPHLPLAALGGHESAVERLTPEDHYAQAWALATLDRALAELAMTYQRSGRGALFTALRDALTGELEAPYEVVAGRLATTPAAVKVAVYRLRQRFATTLRATVAATVADPADVDDELRFLLRALSASGGAVTSAR